MTPSFPMKSLGGMQVCADPAREACFTSAQFACEMVDFGNLSTAEARRERLHRHMNNEIGSIEMAAQCLADFPDAPWELRMELARQAFDECRHVEGLHNRLMALGGYKGEFPISNFEWAVTIAQDSITARLALQNRTFEAGQMDLLATLRDVWRNVGDHVTADLLETILADEVNHVRYANRWIRRLVEADPRQLFKIAQAIDFFTRANVLSAGAEVEGSSSTFDVHVRMGVNIEDRRSAEFTDAEIDEILRQHGMTALADTFIKVPA